MMKKMKYYILLLGLYLLGCNNQSNKQDHSFDLEKSFLQLKRSYLWLIHSHFRIKQ